MNAADYRTPETMDRQLQQAQRWALGLGVMFALICVITFLADRRQFFRSYLFSYLFWLGIALGSLAIEMLQFLTGGDWGVAIRRILEAAARTMPALIVLFLPVLAGMGDLYPWVHANVVAADPVLQHKRPYLNVPFFLVRAVIYFAIWAGGAYLLNRWAEDQYDRQRYVAVRRLSAGGLIIYVFSITFASIDWAQSLTPHWYSTMWGWLFVAAQGLAAMAFNIIVVVLLSRTGPLAAVATPSRLHDLGKLLLMFVMLWAYFSFAQFLIIWAGNLTEEIPWYLMRMATNWGWVGVALIFLQFALPFVLLLSRPLKRHGTSMLVIAGIVLVMRLVDAFWIVTPDFFRNGFRVHWADIVAPVAVGGFWLAAFLWNLRRRPLVPQGDPRLVEALAHAR